MKITTGELLDRLSIVYRKKFYGGKEFEREYDDIKQELSKRIRKMKMNIDTIENIMIITNANADIWANESFVRKKEFEKFPESEQLQRLKFTHAVNDIRTEAKTKINKSIREYPDDKVY